MKQRVWTIATVILCSLPGWGRAAPSASGQLSIDSFTRDAEVFINGKFVGKIPFKGALNLPVGRHTVRVSRLGYGDYVDRVTIRRGAQTNLLADLIPVAGILTVDSQPAGADVIVDGQQLGQTPFKGAVMPGSHELTLHLPDHVLFRSHIELDAGQEERVEARLVFQPSASRVQTKPWYRSHWVWVGVGSAMLAGLIVTAVALSGSQGEVPSGRPINFSTVR
ncbi:MAG: PEGA domain-containing protein [Myxococcota bacterium]|nr:PEGA domain-containing protein [Myxococcota bacterium]